MSEPSAPPTPRLGPATPPACETPEAMAHTLDLIRRGSHPLDMYPAPHLLSHLGPPLDKVITQCWQQQGGRLRHKPEAKASESASSAKAQPLLLDVFLAMLALLPICEPPSWASATGCARFSLVARFGVPLLLVATVSARRSFS